MLSFGQYYIQEIKNSPLPLFLPRQWRMSDAFCSDCGSTTARRWLCSTSQPVTMTRYNYNGTDFIIMRRFCSWIMKLYVQKSEEDPVILYIYETIIYITTQLIKKPSLWNTPWNFNYPFFSFYVLRNTHVNLSSIKWKKMGWWAHWFIH